MEMAKIIPNADPSSHKHPYTPHTCARQTHGRYVLSIMVSFSDAPREVIDQILNHLPRSSLPIVCLVSKSLRHCAEPFLYSTVSLEWGEWDFETFPPIAPLLATLVRRPELFKHLDVVILGGMMQQRARVPPMDTSNVPVDEFEAAIRKAKTSFSDMWVEKLRSAHTCIYALAALLIAHLSRTTHLTITTPWINGQPLVGKVIQAKIFSGQLPQFERLKQLKYLKRRDLTHKNNRVFGETISLFYLPTVTHLEVIMTNPKTFQWPVAAGEPNFSHLTSLKIGWLCEPFLAKILAVARNLESLEWSWEHHGPPHSSDPNIMDFDKITETLQPLKDTLKSFAYTMNLGEEGELMDSLAMPVQGNFRHLRNFTRLTHLEVPLTPRSETDSTPLALADFAPDSVEVLTLSSAALNIEWFPGGWADDDDFKLDDFLPLIQAVADDRPARLTRLRSVVILDDESGFVRRGIGDVRRQIGDRIKKLDLGFEVRFNPS
ncbi:unnamed protein product [Clonostachys rosea f. rosea IK726]|uniref:Uncharacterized protein n=1 Tax=Clonostachys rosea f. rosea IK726 TaxID=1349383 RepID=A0ACA9UH50_BIOOC|nr:unnamed protein product [Clonostachys rosea f. rosea IK726]